MRTPPSLSILLKFVYVTCLHHSLVVHPPSKKMLDLPLIIDFKLVHFRSNLCFWLQQKSIYNSLLERSGMPGQTYQVILSLTVRVTQSLSLMAHSLKEDTRCLVKY